MTDDDKEKRNQHICSGISKERRNREHWKNWTGSILIWGYMNY